MLRTTVGNETARGNSRLRLRRNGLIQPQGVERARQVVVHVLVEVDAAGAALGLVVAAVRGAGVAGGRGVAGVGAVAGHAGGGARADGVEGLGRRHGVGALAARVVVGRVVVAAVLAFAGDGHGEGGGVEVCGGVGRHDGGGLWLCVWGLQTDECVRCEEREVSSRG